MANAQETALPEASEFPLDSERVKVHVPGSCAVRSQSNERKRPSPQSYIIVLYLFR